MTLTTITAAENEPDAPAISMEPIQEIHHRPSTGNVHIPAEQPWFSRKVDGEPQTEDLGSQRKHP